MGKKQDTIYALSTPPGKSAIAIVRISGNKAFNYINKQLPSKSKILLWSNDGYYLDRDYLYVEGFITNMADGQNIYDSDQVIDELKKFGITHVAMTDNQLRKRLKDTLLETGKLDTLYQDNHMTVASIK